MVLTPGTIYGGVVQAGDRVDNQHDYYPMKFNKKPALALSKGDIAFADPTDNGNVRVATTGDKGPFMQVYEDTPAGAPKVHCWHDESNWLIVTLDGAPLPNTKVVPKAGKATPQGADTTTGVYGVYLNPPTMNADITSGDVVQVAGVTAALGVVKVMNRGPGQ